MAEIYEGPDALRAYLTGATAEGLSQHNHGASLGGFCSSARVSCMTLHRFSAFPGVKLRYVDAINGLGVGRLKAVGANTLCWAAPGENYGAAVEILNGQTKVLPSATASKYVVIERTSVLVLRGTENVQLADTLNNIIGMTNFSEAESTAGEAKYRGMVLKNVGTGAISELSVWVDETLDTRLRVAQEATVSGGIQTIADELTQPTGRTWSTPTAGAPLVIGTLAAGATVGVWVERFVAALASANPNVKSAVRISFVYGAVTYGISIRGVGRVAQAGVEGYLYWWGHGAEPDWQNTAHDEFSATWPITLAGVLTANKHWLVERRRNAFGIVGPPKQPIETFGVAGDLTINVAKPSGPSLVQVGPWGAGGYRVDAKYIPEWDDIGYRATHWLIYATTNGVNPNPAVDTPVVVAMPYDESVPFVGIVPLRYDIVTTQLEDSPVRVIVRTRRVVNGPIAAADSENADIHSSALEYCGPERPDGFARYRDGLGIYNPSATITPFNTNIDAPNNIYWQMIQGQTRLWAGGALVWNIKYDSGNPTKNGIYTPLMHDAIDVNAAGGSNPIEVLSWTGIDKRLGINVNGTRRMLFDITSGWIQNNMVSVEDEPSGACQGVPIWPKYAHTVFMVWDPTAQKYVSVVALDTQGRLMSRVGLFTSLTEAECL